MAYTPKTWQCGETIMADDLNHMEQGIAQGGSEPLEITITVTEDPNQTIFTMSETWQRIWEAYPNVYISSEDEGEGVFYKMDLESVFHAGNQGETVYGVFARKSAFTSDIASYLTDSANGYPTFVDAK